MILSSICHVNVDHCQQRCHLQFTMVCADMEIGLGLDSENNNIWICITSGAAEIKKNVKKDFNFFSNLPKSRVGGFEAGLRNYLWLKKKLFTFSTSSLKPPADGASYYARRFPRPRPL